MQLADDCCTIWSEWPYQFPFIFILLDFFFLFLQRVLQHSVLYLLSVYSYLTAFGNCLPRMVS
jgi:hypothetical protein